MLDSPYERMDVMPGPNQSWTKSVALREHPAYIAPSSPSSLSYLPQLPRLTAASPWPSISNSSRTSSSRKTQKIVSSLNFSSLPRLILLAIKRCGNSTIHLLENSFYDLLVSTPNPRHTTGDAFATLLHLADEKINTLPFHAVGAEWLRLYVDATLGLVVAQVLANKGKAPWREWIRKLDMAIIVAGAVGKGRDEAIQRLIKLVQADLAADHLARYQRTLKTESSTQNTEDGPRKRQRTTGPQQIHYSPNAVPELSPPTSRAYRTAHHTKPFIIRRFAQPSSSPAISHWRSAAYLLSLVGPGRVVPVEIGASYTAKEWGQRIVPFELFLSRIGYDLDGLLDDEEEEFVKAEDLPHGQPLYLAQHALLDQFPMLKPDVGPLPDYIYAEPGPEGYVPPGNEQGLILNVWVGNGAGAGHGEDHEAKSTSETSGPVISPAHTVRFRISRTRASTHPLLAGPLLQLLPTDPRRKTRLARTARRRGFNVRLSRTGNPRLGCGAEQRCGRG